MENLFFNYFFLNLVRLKLFKKSLLLSVVVSYRIVYVILLPFPICKKPKIVSNDRVHYSKENQLMINNEK